MLATITLFYFFFLAVFLQLKMENTHMSGLDKERQKDIFINWSMAFLIALCSLRNIATGPDTFSYYNTFEEVKNMDFTEVGNSFVDYIVDGEGKDLGYLVLQKVFGVFFSFRLFLFFIAFLFYWGVGYMLKHTTKTLMQAFIAVILFTTLFLPYALSAVRQTFALGMCMAAFRFIKPRKLIPFLLCVFIGALVHKSALIFIPYYWIANIRATKLLAVATVVAVPVLYFMATPLTVLLVDVSASDQYAYYMTRDNEAGTPTFTLLLLASLVLFLLMRGHLNRNIPDNHFFTNSIYITVALSPVTWVVPDFMRILLYFSIFLPSIISISITNLPLHSLRKIINIAAIIFIAFLFIKTAPNYDFFWNNQPLGDNYTVTINTAGL